MRESLRFLLGDRLVEINRCDPTLTVLDWLRLNQRMTGTKEGCAEGDCGACTVVVGRLDRGLLRYEAINACIRFLPTLDGCQLLTVEHLKGADGALHPVQQAMVECHGSQCGFCTPGFVMSLLALRLNEAEPSVGRIEDVLAGNLCRCTGYEPIIAAGRRMDEIAPRDADRFLRERDVVAARLTALNDSETLALHGNGGRFYAPATVEMLAELVAAHPQATLIAGATDVGLWVTKAMKRLDPVISLGRIEALRAITDEGDHLRFGAMAGHIDVRTALAALSPQLDELMRRFGGEQVRNAGTIGGNIANGSPIGDSPPLLIALGATLHLRHGGKARSLPLERFFLAYGNQDRAAGEVVTHVTVPRPEAGEHIRAFKIAKRNDQDISSVMGALKIGLDGCRIASARIAFGGLAGIPRRSETVEAALIGMSIDDEAAVAAAVSRIAGDFTPMDDHRASARYRLTVAGNLIRKALMEIATGSRGETRIAHLREAHHAA